MSFSPESRNFVRIRELLGLHEKGQLSAHNGQSMTTTGSSADRRWGAGQAI